VERYDGQDNSNDLAYDITLDSRGNVYVTGESWGNGTSYDYITIAYDSSGNEQWVVRYNGPGNDYDQPRAIVSDSLGNVYVTGRSKGNGTGSDFATIKYDSSGNEVWVARYNGPNNSGDEAWAIIIDSIGIIYVTGVCAYSGGKNSDIVTIAYDQDGNELWLARYDNPWNFGDRSRDIAIDFLGNIYVTGSSVGNDTSSDYVTIKYDLNGEELWAARYNGPGNYSDESLAMVTDLSGNVYVTGRSYSSKSNRDYVTIKYDTNGNCLWVARYNGSGYTDNTARAIAVDNLNNVYITGNSYNGYSHDFATIAYDSTGSELWVARYDGLGNGHDLAYDIALDSLGNVYVTGESKGTGLYYDVATVAYDSQGNDLWIMRYNWLQNGKDLAYAIVTDSKENIYVTGFSQADNNYADIITIKYSQEKPILQPIIDIDPNTLNLKSKGRWITCYITLNDPYDVNDIDISTILLEDTIPAEWGDVQGTTLMVKFDRSEVEDMLSPNTYNLKVTGELIDGTSFEGYSDEIRVIEP